MKTLAEIYEGEELELIDSYIEDEPPKNNNEPVWYLGESLKKLSQADVFIGICEYRNWNGCYVERTVANKYKIPVYEVPGSYVIDRYLSLEGSASNINA